MRKVDEHNFIKYLHKKDERALDYVIDVYSGLIRSIIRKHLGEIGHFEEECMNDVLLAIWNSIDRFHEEENSFKNWVAAISKYKSIDYKRKYIKLLQEESFEEQKESRTKSVENILLEQEVSEEIESLLKKLAPTDRNIIKAHYIEEETVEELADRMGVRTSAIYNKLSRSRKKLRLAFEAYKKGGI